MEEKWGYTRADISDLPGIYTFQYSPSNFGDRLDPLLRFSTFSLLPHTVLLTNCTRIHRPGRDYGGESANRIIGCILETGTYLYIRKWDLPFSPISSTGTRLWSPPLLNYRILITPDYVLGSKVRQIDSTTVTQLIYLKSLDHSYSNATLQECTLAWTIYH